MFNSVSTPVCSIITPAYNEANVIGKTLQSLLKDARPNEFEIIIICNGCTDNTANIANEYAPDAQIITTDIASKSKALNLGIEAASTYPLVFLDADIKTTAPAVRAMVHRLNWSDAFLAYGTAKFRTENASWAVRAFYKAWYLNPYFDKQKMGGFFAVSKSGLERLQEIPETLNDDEFVRRRLIINSTWVENAPYHVEPPRDLTNLIKVRSRVYRGNKLLEADMEPLGGQKRKSNAYLFAKRLFLKPGNWVGAAVFAFTALAAHARNYIASPDSNSWESDVSARQLLNK
ncbi:glycosyltransferase [Kordiimonas laminariae]|uniref:glycosyltransferase n=1 Tax=Kordiimonas laminariae TaxID=2917717 RepID=UPI001FF599E2|nr:glycosyltransferase family 2 protein [Kordiimonas laminariae]MCK0067851.1 glycosyltransferase [Kordiimonas laminariae]